MTQILVIDDEAVIRSALTRLLNRHNYDVVSVGSVGEAELEYDLTVFDLIIADLRLPGAPGTDVIKKANGTPVLIMTSYASVKSAVESMRLGAVDYIAKPFDHDEMIMVIDRITKEGRLQRQNAALKSVVQREYPVTGMIGNCQAMKEVFDRIQKVAPTDTNVLIFGESGTGKELVARAVHEASPRKDAPIVTVNCGAIPSELIESELFGHEKGAFTGAVEARSGLVEAADGGTLFLDEIAELPPTAQSGLLRALQDGEVRRIGSTTVRKVDVRVLAATHRDLAKYVAEGRFREDLFFRLHVMEIWLPPLRERGNDVVALAKNLVVRMCRQLNKPAVDLSEDALEAIQRYHWPGNVRELENAIERAVILSDGNEIDSDHLTLGLSNNTPAHNDPVLPGSLDEYFRGFVKQHESKLTETELARRLGISRKTLWERRQRLGIPRSK
ncbi:MAG: sigma-54 dependent transcriptional regulator [Arenicellales bacterium]|nr:sigma-54 dependent transcriptional regulator [Arenicellales bacterium]